MENKYYTPTKYEFRVGFEYEFQTLAGWQKRIVSWNDFPSYAGDYIGESLSTGIRVKYLDREDIESLGWLEVNDHGMAENNGFSFKIKNTLFAQPAFDELKYWPSNHRVRIERFAIGGVFDGTIKNIGELKTLMKQIGIKP